MPMFIVWVMVAYCGWLICCVSENLAVSALKAKWRQSDSLKHWKISQLWHATFTQEWKQDYLQTSVVVRIPH